MVYFQHPPSPPLKILRKEHYRQSPWKNGLGHTAEIAIHPETATLATGDFLWRLSSARMAQDSPFSTFPGYDRTLVILSGGGVRLNGTNVPLLSPYGFSGDESPHCALINGPVTDLNVFVRKNHVRAITTAVAINAGATHPWSADADWNFAFVANGAVTCEGQQAAMGDTILAGKGAARINALQGTARLVLIRIQKAP